MGAQAGLDCVLMIAAGEAGSLTEMKNVRAVKVPKGKTMADVTTRKHGGFKAFIGTLKEFGLEFEVNTDDADAQYLILEDSYWNGTAITVAVLRPEANEDGARKGVKMVMEVETFDESQDNEGQVITTVKLVIRDRKTSGAVVERYTHEAEEEGA